MLPGQSLKKADSALGLLCLGFYSLEAVSASEQIPFLMAKDYKARKKKRTGEMKTIVCISWNETLICSLEEKQVEVLNGWSIGTCTQNT